VEVAREARIAREAAPSLPPPLAEVRSLESKAGVVVVVVVDEREGTAELALEPAV